MKIPMRALLLIGVAASTCGRADAASAKRPKMVTSIVRLARSAVWSPDGKTLALYDDDAGVDLWDAPRSSLRASVADREIHTTPVFSRDSKYFVTVGSDGRTLIRDAATGSLIRVLTGFGKVDQVGSNGDLIAVRTGKSIDIFRVPGGEKIRTLDDSALAWGSVHLSADGLLAACLTEGLAPKVRVWSVATGKLLCVTQAGPQDRSEPGGSYRGDVGGPVLFSHDGKSFWTSGVAPGWQEPPGEWRDGGCPVDYVAKEWDVRTGRLKRIIGGWTTFGEQYSPLALSPDGANLICGGRERIDVWNLRSGSLLRRIQALNALSLDGHWVAGLEESPTTSVKIYDACSGRFVDRVPIGDAPGHLVALALSEHSLAVARQEPSSLTMWNWRSGSRLVPLSPL